MSFSFIRSAEARWRSEERIFGLNMLGDSLFFLTDSNFRPKGESFMLELLLFEEFEG